ncbi:hypothetical protein OIU78_014620 [Salix suchowensis]|nr:hypothetical protein OIU78_014620 [Salix suchowensis]
MEQVHLFTKKLKPTDIAHALSFPTHALEAFSFPEGSHTVRFVAVDATDNVWGFLFINPSDWSTPKTRSSTLFLASFRGAERPCSRRQGLLSSWRVQVKLKGKSGRYTVRAERKVMMLMGQDVWVDVDDVPPVRSH